MKPFSRLKHVQLYGYPKGQTKNDININANTNNNAKAKHDEFYREKSLTNRFTTMDCPRWCYIKQKLRPAMGSIKRVVQGVVCRAVYRVVYRAFYKAVDTGSRSSIGGSSARQREVSRFLEQLKKVSHQSKFSTFDEVSVTSSCYFRKMDILRDWCT